MRRLASLLLLLAAANCLAQERCSSSALLQRSTEVAAFQKQLRGAKVDAANDAIPSAVAEQMVGIKDALSRVTDETLLCEPSTVLPDQMNTKLAGLLHANPPERSKNTVQSQDDHRNDEIDGSYGHNLRVEVIRPKELPNFLEVQYSINIECGSDTMLLIYEFRSDRWVERLRWQSPPLKQISDAFGDFFLAKVMVIPNSSQGGEPSWRLAVAHGTPWCQSRFSGFKMDLLVPGIDSFQPKVIWHIERGYSRGDFVPRMKTSGNTFELRLNVDCMSFSEVDCFENEAIFRYRVDADQSVHRVQPMAMNARGFVQEWMEAPWDESSEQVNLETIDSMKQIHTQFNPPQKEGDKQSVSHVFGPVRGCAAPRIFQVQIDRSLETLVTGKPGGDSRALPSVYFRVQEGKEGYHMLSASTQPDTTCSGPNLMPASVH